MFCSACGQKNEDDATFCTKCGKQITTSTTAQKTSPSAAPVYVSSELKESGAVTAMSVVGFVFGLIGMMGSFIPCLGSLAFYIGIPAALISAIALGIAYSQNTKKTFAIVAVTISLIGVVISGWQYFSIISAGNKAKQELNQMFNQPSTIPSPAQQQPQVSAQLSTQTATPPKIQVDNASSPGWKAVEIIVIEKVNSSKQDFTVNIGQSLRIPNSNLLIDVLNFQPDFLMNGTTITSKSNDPNNPAAQIIVHDNNAEIYKGWLYANFPSIHPVEHPQFKILLKGGLK